MNSDQSIFWVDVELENPLSVSNHQAFVEAINESVKQIADAEHLLPEAAGKNAGIRVVLPNAPDKIVLDRLSFIYSGFKHQRIPFIVVVRSGDSFEDVALPDSASFSRILNEIHEDYK